jgi:hypothetical protein
VEAGSGVAAQHGRAQLERPEHGRAQVLAERHLRGRANGPLLAAAGREMRWFSPRELDRAAIPTLTRKIARAAGFLRE